MLDENVTLTEASFRPAEYSYPRDLALFVHDHWKRLPEPPGVADFCPDLSTLEAFFSVCYHASMLREEERPVTFRAILAPPSIFTRGRRPPDSLQASPVSRSRSQ
jgi:hypothetical protein